MSLDITHPSPGVPEAAFPFDIGGEGGVDNNNTTATSSERKEIKRRVKRKSDIW